MLRNLRCYMTAILFTLVTFLPMLKAWGGEVESLVSRVEKMQESKQFKLDIGHAQEVADQVDRKYKSKEFISHQDWSREIRVAAKSSSLGTHDLNKNSGLGLLLKSLNNKPKDHKITSIRHYPVMVFVSSSLPKESLKALMIESRLTGAAMVFKGAIGSLRNTSEFLQRISRENVSAIIDPRLFDSFDIKSVPSFVVVANSSIDSSGLGATPLHDRMSGNVTLKYALETISQGNGVANKTAKDHLKKIIGEGYE